MRNIVRRLLSSKPPLFLLLSPLLLLVCCSPEGGSEPSATRVSFMVFGDAAEYQAYVGLVDAFHERFAEIEVTLIHIPSARDYRTRLATDYAAGTPPDISLMNYRRYAPFAEKMLLEPLGPYLEKSELIDVQDFYPATIEAFTWQGRELMCVPQNISSLVVYYNQDLFDRAGLPYPVDDWSWEDFVSAAKALTSDSDGDGRTDYYGLGIEPSLFRLAPFIWQNKGQVVDSDTVPTRLVLTRHAALQALQWFVDLQVVHGVVPDRIAETAQDSESRFIGGTTAMFLNSRRGTPTYREITSFKWDVAPLPVGLTAASVLHSDAYCLSSTAADKIAAWRFIEFANSIEGQTIIAGSGRTVPSLILVAESEAFLDQNQPPGRAQVFLDAAEIVRRVPVISTWQEIEDVASAEIERAFYGEITAEEAARLAALRTEEYFILGGSPILE